MKNLKELDDDALLAETHALVQEERRLTLAVLQYLREVERRRLFAARGYASLFDYCVRELAYSESSAQRRIASMRLLRELPELEEQIEAGKLSLTVVSQAQTFFRQEEKLQNSLPRAEKLEVLRGLEGKSSREAERDLAIRSSQPETLIPSRVRPVSESFSELRVVVPQAVLDQLEQLKGLLAHSLPNASHAELIQAALEVALKQLDPAREPQKRRQSVRSLPAPAVKRQGVPAALRREVWRRDQGRCSYRGPKTGRLCGSRHALQVDHRQPQALGGTTNAENLRLLCFQHNQREGIRTFGLTKMRR